MQRHMPQPVSMQDPAQRKKYPVYCRANNPHVVVNSEVSQQFRSMPAQSGNELPNSWRPPVRRNASCFQCCSTTKLQEARQPMTAHPPASPAEGLRQCRQETLHACDQLVTFNDSAAFTCQLPQPNVSGKFVRRGKGRQRTLACFLQARRTLKVKTGVVASRQDLSRESAAYFSFSQ